jgi:transcription antitermination factor NusG
VPVDEREIVSLQKAVACRLALTPCEFFHVGRRVTITRGALEGLEGVLLQVKNSCRLVLSVTLLQRSVQVEIDHDSVSGEAPATPGAIYIPPLRCARRT